MSIKYNGKTIAGNYVPVVADDTQEGIIRISSNAEFKFGENKTTAVTPYQINNYGTTVLSNNNLISDCVTSIPERIKYTLENDVLTIKAGSVIIVPYGTELPTMTIGDNFPTEDFEIVDIQYQSEQLYYWIEFLQDKEITNTANAVRNCFVSLIVDNSDIVNTQKGQLVFIYIDQATSGEGVTTQGLRYSTDTNLVKFGGKNKYSLPFIILDINSNKVITGVQQTFNAVGYIGSTIWFDKNVTYLISNNADKNINYTTTQLYRITVTDSGVLFISPNNDLGNEGILHRAAYYYEQSTPPSINFTPVMLWRNPAENKNYYAWKNGGINEWTEIEYTVLNRYIFESGKIQSLQPLVPLQVAQERYIDGPWTRTFLAPVENKSLSGTGQGFNIDLSSYLPNDGNVYEVALSIAVTTGTTSGNAIIIQANGGGNLKIWMYLIGVMTRTNSSMIQRNSTIIPVQGRTLYLGIHDNSIGTINFIHLDGYRKVR